MNRPFIMHLLVAMVWLFLSGNATFGNFLVALVITFALLALFRKAIGCENYVKRVMALLRFLPRFFLEVVVSNLRVMRMALRRDARKLRGRFIRYDVTGLTDFEVLLIAQCIGLSPGTMAADRSEDGRHLILHVFGPDHPARVRKKIDSSLKAHILAFTR